MFIGGWVYPRACGGTLPFGISRIPTAGLSPRVRGNRVQKSAVYPVGGSIPARAGEPPGPYAWARQGTVYPRACGGTRASAWCSSAMPGLSPRVRGNPRVGVVQLGYAGSIPARAGEPTARALDWADRRVYPRACGGTSQALFPRCSSAGLSPRVRGNLTRPAHLTRRQRSIPARAGEPRCRTASPS